MQSYLPDGISEIIFLSLRFASSIMVMYILRRCFFLFRLKRSDSDFFDTWFPMKKKELYSQGADTHHEIISYRGEWGLFGHFFSKLVFCTLPYDLIAEILSDSSNICVLKLTLTAVHNIQEKNVFVIF